MSASGAEFGYAGKHTPEEVRVGRRRYGSRIGND